MERKGRELKKQLQEADDRAQQLGEEKNR